MKVSSDAQISPIAHIVPDQQEIQRRDLVRALFNDFWSGSDDKPAGFADRLNQAENYINERLAACGEFWQLDAKTRAMLACRLDRIPPIKLRRIVDEGRDPVGTERDRCWITSFEKFLRHTAEHVSTKVQLSPSRSNKPSKLHRQLRGRILRALTFRPIRP